MRAKANHRPRSTAPIASSTEAACKPALYHIAAESSYDVRVKTNAYSFHPLLFLSLTQNGQATNAAIGTVSKLWQSKIAAKLWWPRSLIVHPACT